MGVSKGFFGNGMGREKGGRVQGKERGWSGKRINRSGGFIGWGKWSKNSGSLENNINRQ
jgi:hypothetical protein